MSVSIHEIVVDSYTSVFHEAQVLFEELLSLRDFYHQFVASYLKVGSELQRRQRYQLEIQSIVSFLSTVVWGRREGGLK
jgi:hypothetical protein